jgi:hypothetical protein
MENQKRAPGYYSDPKGEADERYFDGTNWTTVTRHRMDAVVKELKTIRVLLIVMFVWLVVLPFIWGALV